RWVEAVYRPYKTSGLGVGVVWWPPLDVLCRESEGLIDVIEAEPEAFWVPEADGFRSFVGEALKHLTQPKLLHSVGAPACGACATGSGHAAAMATEVAELPPEYVSDHLTATQFPTKKHDPAVSAGFMLAAAQSKAGAELAAANILEHSAALDGTPLGVEATV